MKKNEANVVKFRKRIKNKAVQSKILPEIVYASEELAYCLDRALNVAPTDCTVLIEGETGVGKEHIAHLIHEQSRRSNREMIIVDCATLDENMIISDLFGHPRGAFTGAEHDKEGYFQIADGSTIFLDEIGELPLGVQIRLLRILQEKNFTRLGETKTRQVDVRIIAATNKQLVKEVREKNFREDLFFRINKFSISVPPLRNRKDDILVLANYFKGRIINKNGPRIVRFTKQALDCMISYNWPGNVRQLQNIVERALINCQDKEIRPEHLELETETVQTTMNLSPSSYAPLTLKKIEKYALATALDYTHGNQKRAAEILGITPRIIGYKIDKHDIDVETPLKSIKDLKLPGFPTENFKIRMLEETIQILKKKIKGQKKHSAEKTDSANPEDPDKTKKKINLPQQKLNDAKDAPNQILQLNGASEFVAKYPGITIGKTTLAEATAYARIAHFVVHLNAGGGKISEAAKLMEVKSSNLYVRKKKLFKQGFDVQKLCVDPRYSGCNIPIGSSVNAIVTDIRKGLLSLLYRFSLGDREKILILVGTKKDNYLSALFKYKINKSIITEHDRLLCKARNKLPDKKRKLEAQNKLLIKEIDKLKNIKKEFERKLTETEKKLSKKDLMT